MIYKRGMQLYCLMVIVLLIIAFTNIALADKVDDTRITQSNDQNLQTTGDVNVGATTLSGGDTNVSTGGNKTFAFAHGLGDVDINEGQNCYGSEAWGSIIVSRQTLELNPWCASLFYELNGRHDFAAKMRCDIKEIGDKYTTEEACWTDQQMSPNVAPDDVSSAIAVLQLQINALATELTHARDNSQEQLQVQMALIEEVQKTPTPTYRPPPQVSTKQQAGLRVDQQRDLEALFAEILKEDEDE
jgi:hypothetical protein